MTPVPGRLNDPMGHPSALDALLRPRSIAIIGASMRAGSFGERLLAAVTSGRYPGSVYPVNPGYGELAGLPCYRDLSALPEIPDCAAFAVSDEQVETALAAAAAAGVRGAVLFGRAYEPSHHGVPSRVERLAAIARAAGMAVCGANCMGFVNFVDGLQVTGNPPPLPPSSGTVALVSHSGSTWSGLVGNQRQLVYNYAVSAGQEIATTIADYIEYFLAQPDTRVIGCVMETVRDPERFLAAIENADRRGIPIVVLKLGRSERGRRFALAHSGALAGSDAAYSAIFARHNVVRVHTVDELTDTLELFNCPRRPGKGGVGIVTDSGGERELIVDLATDIGVPLAEVTPQTASRLTGILDPGMEPQNPVDSYGDGRMLLEECLQALADDDNVAVVAMATNLVYGRAYATASSAAMERAFAATAKPALLFSNIHSSVSREEAERLRALGVPVLMGTATALSALRHLIDWQQARRVRDVGRLAAPPPALVDAARELIRNNLPAEAGQALALPVALELLEMFDIASAPCAFVSDASATIAAAERLGFPVVLKTAEPAILHKTEAGGVAVGLTDRAAVAAAYARISAACGPFVQVQAQVAAGTEILLGMTNDPQFGPMVTAGLGGIFTEVMHDVVTFTPSASEAEIHGSLSNLRGYRLLRGYRGQPPVDIAALVRFIRHFADLCGAIGPLLDAVDLNPVIAGPTGAVAVDALFLAAHNLSSSGCDH